MRIEMTRDRLKYTFVGLGLVLAVGSATLWILDGFTVTKLLVGFVGLFFFAVGWMGRRAVNVYKQIAVTLLNTILMLFVLEGAASLVLRFFPFSDPRVGRETLAHYKNAGLGESYLREFKGADNRYYVPYVIWKDEPFAGKFINVDRDGNRVTPGARCESNSYVVFMFGGSTMWGYGAPDQGTIPTYFQTEITSLSDRPICVRNFGQTGWVSTQSVIELLRHLQPWQVPNLVIFYYGFNDITFAQEEGVPGGHESLEYVSSRLNPRGSPSPLIELVSQTRIFELMQRLAPKLAPHPHRPEFEAASMGNAVVQAYLTNYLSVKALAAQFGFEYAFFWQPSLIFGQKPLTVEEKAILSSAKGGRLEDLLKTVYPAIQARTKYLDRLFFFADTFQNETEWLYLDEVHIVPGGNQKIARRMLETLLNSHCLKEANLRLSSNTR